MVIPAVFLQAELDMTGWPRNWQAAIQRVLEGVLKLPEATIFAEPVPLDETPGYRELISNPMDLGTILGRAKADAYDTPLEALADVRQVCFLHLSALMSHVGFIRHALAGYCAKLVCSPQQKLLKECRLAIFA